MVHPSRWPRVLAIVSMVALSMCISAQAQTFSNAVDISNLLNDNANTPQVAVDASGNIYVVWEDDAIFPQQNILFSYSTDQGKTFSSPLNLSKSTTGAFNPRIAVDSQGGINIVYVDNPGNIDTVYFTRSTDGGKTFSQPLNVSSPQGGQSDATTPEIAVDASGHIHVVWVNSNINFGVFYSRSTDNGSSFSAPKDLDANTSQSFAPQVAVDATNGNVYVVWDDLLTTPKSQIQIFFSASTNNGLAFSASQNISNDSGNASSPQMALDSNGNINVVWTDNSPGNNQIFFSRSSNQGTTFSAATTVFNQTAMSTNSLVAADANGNIFVVWQNGASKIANHDIWFASLSNGATNFSVAQNLSQSAASGIDSANPWLTVDQSGNVNVSWEEALTSTTQIFFTQSTNSGASFAAAANASNDNGYDTQVQIAAEAGGNLDFVWSDDLPSPGNNQVFFSRFTPAQAANTAPVVNAGADQTMTATGPTTPVTLSGSATDPDGDAITSFVWTQSPSATPVGTSASVSLNLNVGTYTFTLTATDSAGLKSSAITHVTINNAPPVANAGLDQTLTATGPTTPVTLNGSASDPDGDALTYVWTQGTTVIGNSASVPLSLNIGSYTYTLTVTDAGGLSSTATTHVTINNASPVANAGADQIMTATGPTTPVTLNGSGSDPDGEALTFAWTQGTTPIGNTPTVSLNLKVGTYAYTLTVTDASGASASSTTHVTINNAPPVANAGVDQTLTATGPTTPVTLNGSATDPDGDALTYVWTQGATQVGNTAVLPLNLSIGTYTYTLTVTDAGGLSSSAITHVTINNAPPVANAGVDQTLTATGPTTPVTLNGSGSDPDGEALTFVWTQGSTVVGNTAVLPLSLNIGTYTYTLTVTDASGTSASSTTHVTINNALPVANAGVDQTLTATGQTTPVTLNGSGSDPDGEALTFAWTQGSTVVGNTAVLPLNLKVGGPYTFTLTVTDASGASASSTTHVTINNAPPVANAGADQTMTATGPTTPVTLNGSGTDPDGDALTYVWMQGSTAVGNSAVLPLSLKIGTYTFTLTVTDAGGLTSTSTTHVMINDAPPVANAGPDQSVTATGPTALVTLNGSGSSDVDGDALTFVWTQGSTVVGNSAMVQLNLKQGTYTFTLTVTDAGGLSSSAVTHVSVTHGNQPPVANVAADPVLECTGPAGASMTLNGSASTDPNGYALQYLWTDESGKVVGRSAIVTIMVPLGTHIYTLKVTDTAGLSAMATTSVTVQDTVAPALNVSVSPTDLWPPDHKMKLINASVSASDVCDPNPAVKLVSITSSDPRLTSRDNSIQSSQGGSIAFGTDVQAFLLRAEMTEAGADLTYTIKYSATDASGNSTVATAMVVVGHQNKPNGPAVKVRLTRRR